MQTMILLVAAVLQVLSSASNRLPLALPPEGLTRIYVDALPCAQSGQKFPESPGKPIVRLFNRQQYGDGSYDGFYPAIVVTGALKGESNFYFDVKQGNYEVSLKFSNLPGLFVANGPLIAVSQHDRHLFVAGCSLTDWHDVGAIAGKLPLENVDVSVLTYDHPMRCGDLIRSFGAGGKLLVDPRVTDAVVDSGEYYANFHGYGRQDRTVALEFSGALFTSGAILLTEAPDTPPSKPPFILKDITRRTMEAATLGQGKLVCMPGF